MAVILDVLELILIAALVFSSVILLPLFLFYLLGVLLGAM